MRRDIVPRLSRARADRAAAFSSAGAPRGGRPSDAALDGGAAALRDLFEVILICPIRSGRIVSSGWLLPTGTLLWEPLSSEFTREAPAVQMPI